ncbi:MAG TPA: PRC-barrel domain-containing protein [Stellaceae bacterium]|jgi:hypothetical protein|nr:PRC-barrel domain-containing protein [Stellaceae bacterium]
MRASAITSRRALAGTIGALALLLAGVAGFTVRCAAAAIITAQNQPETPAAPAPGATPKEDRPKNGSTMPENVKPLPPGDAVSVLGKKVRGANGEDLGLIVDVLVAPQGQPRAAVIDFGGFLGVGSRKIAIDWKALDFAPLVRAGTVGLGLDRAQIAAAPEYKPGPAGADVVMAPSGPSPPADTHK